MGFGGLGFTKLRTLSRNPRGLWGFGASLRVLCKHVVLGSWDLSGSLRSLRV